MRNQWILRVAFVAFVILTGFINSGIVSAQERIPIETPEALDQRDRMAWKDYNQEVNSRYEKIMSQVDRMKRQMVDKKMDNPQFRKSLNKFEANATVLHERMKNAENIAPENQDTYRKKMRSELQKLGKEYNKLMNRWEKMSA